MKERLDAWWNEVRRWLQEPNVIWRCATETLQVTIEVRQWIPFLAFLVTLTWYMASPSPVALIATATLGGMLIGAFLWARMQARLVRGQRRLRFVAMQVGDVLEEEICLENRAFFPLLWVEFIDRSNLPGYTVSSVRAADPNSQVQWRAHTICTRRGVFTLGPWELRMGEPFGILRVRQCYRQRQEILVYPPLATLPEQLLLHHGAPGGQRPLNQPLPAETVDSTSVRPLAPGDPLRHIHWRTTARHEAPYVKVFAPQAASNIWLLPDFDQAVHIEGAASSQETMVTVVASLAASLLQQNLSVGLLASAQAETVVLPRQGQPHLWRLLQALAPLYSVPERPLKDVLARARTLIGGNDLLILVTPSLQVDWVDEIQRVAHNPARSGRAEVVVLDPGSFQAGGPPAARGENAGGAPRGEDFVLLLQEQGLRAHLLRREDVIPLRGTYGEISRWEFAVLGTGRVVTRRAPRSAAAAPAAAGEASAPWRLPENRA